MVPIFLDFETFYGKGYSLRSPKLSLSDYVRDPRFKAHMVGWAVDKDPVQWVPHEDIADALHALPWDDAILIAHNTAFDGFVLSHHYDIVPRAYGDTMLMSRAYYGAGVRHGLDALCARLGIQGKFHGALEDTKDKVNLTPEELERLAEYCANDVDIMAQAYDMLLPLIPVDERELMHITLQMFCDPVLRIDRPRVEAELAREIGNKAGKQLIAGVTAENLLSNEKFAKQLISLGVNPPMKTSPATGEPTFAFAKQDVEFLRLKEHPDVRVRRLIEARLVVRSTIGETRAERFLKATDNDWWLPVLLQYCGAHTTRWSAGDKMNLQNLTRGGELRKSILAPPGYVLCPGDSSQIEARINLWLADDKEKLDIFRAYDAGTGPDLYKVMAAMIFDKPIEHVTPVERQLGKVCVLALGYGMGPDKFKHTLATDKYNPQELSREECCRIVSMYRNANQPITQLWKMLDGMLSWMMVPDSQGRALSFKALEFKFHEITLPSGLSLHYENMDGMYNGWTERYVDVKYDNGRGATKLYGGMLDENITQALARCVVAEQMLKIAERYRVVMMTHDEIVFLAPEEEGQQALDWALEIMKKPPRWAPDLPVNAEGKFAPYYSK